VSAITYQQAIDALESAVSEPQMHRGQIKQAVADLIEVCDWMRDEAADAVEDAGEVFGELNAFRAAAGVSRGCGAPPQIRLKCGCVVTVGLEATPSTIDFISACADCSEVLHRLEAEDEAPERDARVIN
jgi:hypothetical protein